MKTRKNYFRLRGFLPNQYRVLLAALAVQMSILKFRKEMQKRFSPFREAQRFSRCFEFARFPIQSRELLFCYASSDFPTGLCAVFVLAHSVRPPEFQMKFIVSEF